MGLEDKLLENTVMDVSAIAKSFSNPDEVMPLLLRLQAFEEKVLGSAIGLRQIFTRRVIQESLGYYYSTTDKPATVTDPRKREEFPGLLISSLNLVLAKEKLEHLDDALVGLPEVIHKIGGASTVWLDIALAGPKAADILATYGGEDAEILGQTIATANFEVRDYLRLTENKFGRDMLDYLEMKQKPGLSNAELQKRVTEYTIRTFNLLTMLKVANIAHSNATSDLIKKGEIMEEKDKKIAEKDTEIRELTQSREDLHILNRELRESNQDAEGRHTELNHQYGTLQAEKQRLEGQLTQSDEALKAEQTARNDDKIAAQNYADRWKWRLGATAGFFGLSTAVLATLYFTSLHYWESAPARVSAVPAETNTAKTSPHQNNFAARIGKVKDNPVAIEKLVDDYICSQGSVTITAHDCDSFYRGLHREIGGASDTEEGVVAALDQLRYCERPTVKRDTIAGTNTPLMTAACDLKLK